jgi:hypothetical protein
MQEALRGVQFQTYGETVINPFVLAAVILAGLAFLFIKRKYAILPFLCVVVLCTGMQRVVIFDLDFTMIRLMVMFGFVRVLIKDETRLLQLNNIDKAFIMFQATKIVTYTLLWQTTGAFINRLGGCMDALGTYLLCRVFIRSIDEAAQTVKYIIVFSIPIALSMMYEKITQRNLFSFMGGVPEITMVREGRLRCQGKFAHPILAGTYGASLASLVIGCFLLQKKKIITAAGIVSSLFITYTSSSSGPVLTFLSVIFGWALWPFRRYMRIIFWGGIAVLGILQLAMQAPVWFILARIAVVGGSTAYHRAALVDAAVRNFREWWLVGTHGSGHWGWGLEDVTNNFVRVAIDSGLGGLLLFVFILFLCFRTVGKKIKRSDIPLREKKFIWAFGVYLFAHCVSFWGVSYFDPAILFFLNFNIAVIAAIADTSFFNQSSRRQSPATPVQQTA